MKTSILLTVLMIGMIIGTFAQKPSITLTFTAEYNGQYVPLDSIIIENITQGVDTTLYAPDNVLVLDYITSIPNEIIERNTIYVSQNYPNPFEEKTKVDLFLPQQDDIEITIRDILGRELAYYKNTLNRGNHTFAFYSGNENYNLLTISGKQTSHTIKMLSVGSNTANSENCKIVYLGNNDKVSDFKAGQAINNFVYNLGDELMFSAYALTDIENLGSSIIVDTPTMDTIYQFDIIGGLRCPGMPAITDIDGNTYNTVQIGDQCWMKENLKTTTYKNGTNIDYPGNNNSAWENNTTGAFAWLYNDISWKDSYGALYNWHAVNNTNGLCPTGWHVPTIDEWTALTDHIGGTGSPNGNKLKSCRQVNSPLGGGCNTSDHPRWNSNSSYWGTDDYGFSGLPGGVRINSGNFYDVGFNGYWWSSTEYSSYYAWFRYLYYYDGGVSVNYANKHYGFSVRCLRD